MVRSWKSPAKRKCWVSHDLAKLDARRSAIPDYVMPQRITCRSLKGLRMIDLPKVPWHCNLDAIQYSLRCLKVGM